MPLFNILTISVLIGSLLFLCLALWRLFCYNRKYHLPESKYTKMFGVVTKEYVALLYVTLILIHFVFGMWFVFTL